MKEIIEEINLFSMGFLSYFKTKTPFGYIIFLSWFITKRYNIWILKILTPHVVDPAQPPINISSKNRIKVKLPQVSNSAFTYPVPVNIEIILNDIDLKFNSVTPLIVKYIERIIMLMIIIFKKVLIWASLNKIFLFPFINLI